MTNYQELLRQLEEEQETIGRLIVFVKGKMAQQDEVSTAIRVTPETISKQTQPIMRFPRSVAPDAFFRMTVQGAIEKCLNLFKTPMSAKDITAALNEGGLTHQAKNLYATVYPTLLRMETDNEIARVGKGKWGLSEWYGSRKTNQEEKPESES